jgi:phenol 2-monooxygenase
LKLISIDQRAAAAVSGEVPAEYKALGLSVEEAMTSIFERNLAFTVGLGISYETSVLNREPLAATLLAGTRSPDALLYTPGPTVPVRLHDITHRQSKGRWTVLVFAGHAHCTRDDLIALRRRLEAGKGGGVSIQRWSQAYQLATVMVGRTWSSWDAFDGPSIGKLYFDKDGVAHARYGVYPDNGAILVVRPDGIFAYAAPLHELEEIWQYFDAIFA